MSHEWELQKAIYAVLTAASISGVQSIRDNPNTEPSTSDYPFIEISTSQDLADDTGGDDGTGDEGLETYFDIDVWSRYRGQKEVKEIMGAVYDALHHQSLTVTGRSTAFCWLDDKRIIDSPDGLTRHGIMTFKITHRS